MNWHAIGSWAFGFFTPLVVPSVIVGGIGMLALWFDINEHFHLDQADAWTGGVLCVGIVVVGFALAVRFIG